MGRLGRIGRNIQGTFIGRRQEQQDFRSAIKQFLQTTPKADDSEFPQLFLVYGIGGIGKSTLVDRFASICIEEDKRKIAKLFKIDWEKLGAVASSIEMMDILCDHLSSDFWGEFKQYRAKRLNEKEVRRKVEDARQQYEPLVSAVAEGLSGFTHTGSIGKAAIETFVHSAGSELAKREDQFNNWLKQRLSPDEFLLFKRPQLELSKEFVKALTQSAERHPIIFIFDSYELVNKFDGWVREALFYNTLDNSSRVFFTIAGRYDHSIAYRNTLTDSFLKLIDLRAFSKGDVEDYLRARFTGINRLSKNEFEQLVNLIFDITQGVPYAVYLLVTVINQNQDIEINFGDMRNQRLSQREIVAGTTLRFLKYCIEREEDTEEEKRQKRRDRDYIYTFAVLKNYEDWSLKERILDVLWKKSIGYSSPLNDASAVQEYLLRKYSFMFTQTGVMHPVVREFVQRALRDGSIPRGHLNELNQAAKDYFQAKLQKYKGDYQGRFNNLEWQEATISLLNHLFWLSEYEEGIRLLVNTVVMASQFAHFEYRDKVLSLIGDDTGLRQYIPHEYDEIIQSLVHIKNWVGSQSANITPVTIKFRTLLFDWLNRETQILNEISQMEDMIRFRGSLGGARNRLKDIEARCAEGEFQQERAKIHLLLGYKYLQKREIAEAEPLIRRSIELNQTNAQAYIALGDLMALQSQWEEATTAYQQACEIDPSSSYTQNKFIKALKIAQQITLQGINSDTGAQSWSLVRKGIAYSRCGNLSRATQSFQEAIDIDPSNFYARVRLGNALRQLGDLDESIKVLNELLHDLYALAGNFSSMLSTSTLDGLGASLLLTGNFELAIGAYQKAISKSKNYINAHNGLGMAYLGKGNTKEASRHLENAIKLNSNAYWVYNNLGVLASITKNEHASKQHFSHGEQYARYALKNRGSYYHATYHLGLALAGQKNIENSLDAFREAIHQCNGRGIRQEMIMILKIMDVNFYSTAIHLLAQW